MPKITSHRITSGDYEYELDIDLKDAAIMQNQAEFEVAARRRHRREREWQEESVTLRFDLAEGVAQVLYRDEEVGRIDLSQIDIPEDTPAEIAWEMIAEAWEGSLIEEVIQSIPTDPVVGCLLKAGISTTVGQTIRCYRQAVDVPSLSGRIRQTLLCLGDNTLRMIMTATARTLRCVVLAGLG
jgi:hypothetical protein